MTSTITHKLVGYVPDGNDTCRLCGHGIKRLFYVRDLNGATFVVGSECVEALLGVEDKTKVELMTKRTNRAARQWKAQEPRARDGETQVDYINRRVAEMTNARRAYNVWLTRIADYRVMTADAVITEIENTYCANRFDFCTTAYKVRKI